MQGGERLEEYIIELMWEIPELAGLLLASWISGFVWSYIFMIHVKTSTRGNSILKMVRTKVVIGICWNAMLIIPIYYSIHRSFGFTYKQTLNLLIPTVIFGLGIVFVILLLLELSQRGKIK